MAEKHNLPMYFHAKQAVRDFISTVKNNRKRFSNGVVNSFVGSMEAM